MKLKKSVYLTIALFGLGASSLAHSAIYTFQPGDQTTEFINRLNSANDGDEFVINGEVKVLRQNGIITIPKSITFKSADGSYNSKLHIEGANLDIKGKTVKFENLDLSLKPSRTLNEIFASNFGNGTTISAKPTFIATNGNNLILNNVGTKVESENENTRPIILLSGGKNGEKETLTIENENNKTENKFYSIVLDSRYSFNSNGQLIKTETTTNDTNNVEINVGKNVAVIDSLKLSGFDDGNTFNGNVDVKLKSKSVKQIDNPNTNKVNLTLTEIDNVGINGILNLKNNANFATITLDRSNLSIDTNITISHLILKDGSVLDLAKPFSMDDYDETHVVANIENLEVTGEGKSALVSTKNKEFNKIVIKKINKDNGEITFEVYNLEKNLSIENLNNASLVPTGEDRNGNSIYEIRSTKPSNEETDQPTPTQPTPTQPTENTTPNTEDGSTTPAPNENQPVENDNENSTDVNETEEDNTENSSDSGNETESTEVEPNKDNENPALDNESSENTEEDKKNEKETNSIEELNKTLKLIKKEFEKNQKPSLDGKIDFELLNQTQQQVLNLKSVPYFKNKHKVGVYVNVETQQGEMFKEYNATNHSIEIGGVGNFKLLFLKKFVN